MSITDGNRYNPLISVNFGLLIAAILLSILKQVHSGCSSLPSDYCGGYRGTCIMYRVAEVKGNPNANFTCMCRKYYTGSRCEMVDWSYTVRRSIGSMLFIEWPESTPTGSTPLLRSNYAFIYYRVDPLFQKIETDHSFSRRRISNSRKHTTQEFEMRCKVINMPDNSNALMIDSLGVGGATYRICIEQRWRATRILDLGDRNLLTNCIVIVTSIDYNSLAGWMVIIGIIITIFILIFIQRDRIKLVYFSKQPPVVFVAPSEEVNRRSIIPI